jgi:hypothetical protein
MRDLAVGDPVLNSRALGCAGQHLLPRAGRPRRLGFTSATDVTTNEGIDSGTDSIISLTVRSRGYWSTSTSPRTIRRPARRTCTSSRSTFRSPVTTLSRAPSRSLLQATTNGCRQRCSSSPSTASARSGPPSCAAGPHQELAVGVAEHARKASRPSRCPRPQLTLRTSGGTFGRHCRGRVSTATGSRGVAKATGLLAPLTTGPANRRRRDVRVATRSWRTAEHAAMCKLATFRRLRPRWLGRGRGLGSNRKTRSILLTLPLRRSGLTSHGDLTPHS